MHTLRTHNTHTHTTPHIHATHTHHTPHTEMHINIDTYVFTICTCTCIAYWGVRDWLTWLSTIQAAQWMYVPTITCNLAQYTTLKIGVRTTTPPLDKSKSFFGEAWGWVVLTRSICFLGGTCLPSKNKNPQCAQCTPINVHKKWRKPNAYEHMFMYDMFKIILVLAKQVWCEIVFFGLFLAVFARQIAFMCRNCECGMCTVFLVV